MARWVIKSRDELIAAIRERRDDLDLSCLTIDGIAGWADGYAGKALSPNPMKGLGPKALEAILGALALKIVRIEIVDDPDQAAKAREGKVEHARKALEQVLKKAD